MITFIIAFLDRTNISFAIPTMGKELNLFATAVWLPAFCFWDMELPNLWEDGSPTKGTGSMLKTLQMHGYIDQDSETGKYRLGMRLLEMP
jgi:hypothetical protein